MRDLFRCYVQWQAAAVTTVLACSAVAQVIRLGSGPSPNVGGLDSISLSVTPGTVNFNLVPGSQVRGTANISISTAVHLSVISTLRLYAYFPTTEALRDAAGDIIPSTAIFGQCASGVPTALTPFSQATPFGPASGLLLYQQGSVLVLGQPIVTSCSLAVDLSTRRAQPAGNYTGTLIIQAQAM